MSFILGKKIRMTQVWEGEKVTPVTVIKATPNTISLVRTQERDGYQAVQLSLGRTKREFRVPDSTSFEKGSQLSVDAFAPGEKVRVSGTSKGRGFQGGVKRYNFRGGPATHGQKNRLRAPGSIGSTAPQRVVPGRRMAGHMGDVRITVKNLRVVQIDPAEGLILLEGAVPGAPNSLVEIITAAPTKRVAKATK